MSWQTGAVDRSAEPTDEWSIGEVCARTGLSARTVRYYEELGLLPGVRRRSGGRRVYGGDELERLRFIQRLKALGLSLQEVKELNALYALGGSTATMLERLDDLLGAHLRDLDTRIDELIGLRDEMNRYREHVAGRIASLGGGAGASDTSSTSERAVRATTGGTARDTRRADPRATTRATRTEP